MKKASVKTTDKRIDKAKLQTNVASSQAETNPEENSFLVTWNDLKGETHRGPLFVLSRLIENYKVDIYKVSLEEMTNDFLLFLQKAKENKLELALPFFNTGAQLIFYKSQALLPTNFEDDEEPLHKLPKELIEQLLTYKKFQNVAQKLQTMHLHRIKLIARPPQDEKAMEPARFLKDINAIELTQTWNRLQQKQEKKVEPIPIIAPHKYTVSQKITFIEELLKTKKSFPFEILFKKIPNKPTARHFLECITAFLAILEMTRNQKIRIIQKHLFAPIRIEIHTPKARLKGV